MMLQCSIILLSLAPAAARVIHSNVKGHGAHTMDADMRPEVVSQLLSTVEAKWTQEALNVFSNQTAEPIALGAMENSCVKVSSAVVQGSDGDRLRVIDYMKTVCGEPNAKSNIEMCTNFGNAIQEFMIGDNVYNREQLDMHDFCGKFWKAYVMPAGEAAKKKLDTEEQQVLAAEKKREEDEMAQRKKLAEEAAKKKMMEELAKNNTGLAVATQWNAVQKKQQSQSEVTHWDNYVKDSSANVAPPTVSSASSNATAPNTATQNKTETPKNATSDTGVQNSTRIVTKAVRSLIMHNTTRTVQNATVQKNQAAQNATVQKNLTLTVETVGNQTQPQKNSTKLVITNRTVFHEQLNATSTVQGKLTDKVIKQLKFVLNHTKRIATNTTKNSTNITS